MSLVLVQLAQLVVPFVWWDCIAIKKFHEKSLSLLIKRLRQQIRTENDQDKFDRFKIKLDHRFEYFIWTTIFKTVRQKLHYTVKLSKSPSRLADSRLACLFSMFNFFHFIIKKTNDQTAHPLITRNVYLQGY